MKRIFIFSFFFGLFWSKSSAQTDFIELRTAPVFGAQCIELAEMRLLCGGQPTVVLPAVPCDFDPALVPAGCKAEPHKNINPLNGVTLFDGILIGQHILGITPFDSPFKFIAADINRSGHVSTADILDLRKLLLGIVPNFSNNESWRFISEDFGGTTTGSNDFIGIKIGDLNGSADPTVFTDETVENRSPIEPFPLQIADVAVEKDQIFEAILAFKTDQSAVAFQFSIEHDGLEILEILDEKGEKSPFAALFPTEKRLAATWLESDGAPVFRLKIRAEKAGRLSDFLKISDRKTRSEGYSSDGQAHVLSLDFFEKTENAGPQFFQNQPNPFDESTSIRFFLNEKEAIALEIFDAAGRLVFSKKLVGEKGLNELELSKNELGSAGLFLLKMTAATGSATRKMVLKN